MYFFELLHQIGLGLQPSCRVDDANIGVRLDRGGNGAVSHSRGVTPLPCLDDFDAEPIGPDRELLDCCCAKRVAGTDDDFLAFGLETMCELGDRSRFTRTIDTDNEHDG